MRTPLHPQLPYVSVLNYHAILNYNYLCLFLYKDAITVAQLVKEAGIESTEGEIAYCNTGHWATVAWFALSEVLGHENVKNYDGSMVEWTADPSRPLENNI